METEKQQSMLQTYRQFMQIGLNGGDPGLLRKIVDEHISGFGSAMDEKVHGFDGLSKLLDTQIKQSKGLDIRWRMEPVSQFVTPDENTAVFADDVFLRIDSGEEIIEMYLRFSAVLHYIGGQWKVIHWHGSKPEAVESEKDTWGLESWKQKAGELEKLVAEKTSDLVEKNRELEIEAALERVRARTMAMQKSDELPEAANLLFQQVQSLGMPAWSAGYCIWNDDKSAVTLWMSSEGVLQPPFIAPTTEDELFKQMRKGLEDGKDLHICEMGGKDLELHYQYMRTLPVVGKILDSIIDAGHPLPTFQIMHQAYFSKGFLLFITYEPVPEAHEIFKRFASVFDQTYTRFLDLQKAEAQAREAQIETALERIRARALAMHNSNELTEVAKVLREQMSSLGQPELETSAVHLYDEDPDYILSWRAFRLSSYLEGNITYGFFKIPKGSCEIANEFIEKFKSSETDYTIEVSGARQAEWYKILFKLAPEVHEAMKNSGTAEETRYYHFSKFSGGALLMVSSKEPSKDAIELQKRSAQVFDLAYRRFKDLQKVEEQAREAQIEAALERLRSRSMAMHDSSDLSAVVFAMFTELVKLDAQLDRCLILIVNPQTLGITWYLTGKEGLLSNNGFFIPDNNHPSHKAYLDGWRTKRKKWQYLLAGEEKKQWDAYGFFETELKQLPDFIKADMAAVEAIHLTISSDDFGCLIASSLSPLSDTHASIVERFTIVFNQTYTRFLDLKKAEAQAREAEIQLALERVRARSLAMHHTNELQDVVNVVAQQLLQMGIDMDGGVFIAINDEVTNDFPFWAAAGAADYVQKVTIPFFDRPTFTGLRDAIVQRQPFYTDYFSKEEKNEFLLHMFRYHPWNQNSEERKAELLARDGGYTRSVVVNHYTSIGITNHHGKKFSDSDYDILKRFGAVLEQSYIRFLDLQKAEAQAREAQIEAALERVRSRSMAMHKSEELSDLSLELVRQVQALGVATWFCAFNIHDDDPAGSVEWGSNGQGVFSKYRTPREGIFLEYYEAWQRGEVLHIHEFTEDKCPAHYEYLCTLPGVGDQLLQMKAAGIPFPKYQIDHVAFFKHGYIIFITYEPVPETHHIFKRFAKAFEQTYTRFLDLQKAEAQAREAQIETALERVRSRTMGMQKSTELNEVAFVLFEQIRLLGGHLWGTGFALCNMPEGEDEFWFANEMGVMPPVSIPNTEDEEHKAMLQGWKENREYLLSQKDGESLAAHYRYLYSLPQMKAFFDPMLSAGFQFPARQQWHAAYFSKGYLLIITTEPYAEPDIFKRFAKVFDQTYTRFLDLQRAEAQAREAQIEVAVERVRAKALAMHKSSEISALANTLRHELVGLNIPGVAAATICLEQEDGAIRSWDITSTVEYEGEFHFNMDFVFDLTDTHPTDWIRRVWDPSRKYYIIEQDEADIQRTIAWTRKYNSAFADTAYRFLTENSIKQVWHPVVSLEYGKMSLDMFQPPPAETEPILIKMGAAFDLAYKRFLDLQKAEAQAREAQIQLGLERVRARTMAMQKQQDLFDVVNAFGEQLVALGLRVDYVSFINGIISKDRDWDLWGCNPNLKLPAENNLIPYKKTAYFTKTAESVDRYERTGYPIQVKTFTRDEKDEFFDHYFSYAAPVPQEFKQFLYDAPGSMIVDAFLSEVTVSLCRYDLEPYTEEQLEIFKRFSIEFRQAYIRFLDLQKAEAQARVAQVERSLERIRAHVTSMQKSSDLFDIVVSMRNEFISLGHQADYFWHMRWASEHYELSMTSDDGSRLGMVINVPKFVHEQIPRLHEWEKGNSPVMVLPLNADEAWDYVNKMNTYGSFELIDPHAPTEEDIRHIGGLTFIIARTTHGEIGYSLAGEVPDPPKESQDTLVRFAGVFDLAYKRFEDLKEAEKRNRETQIELALERVRSRTMAMQHSDELSQTAAEMFAQLQLLGIQPWSCGFNIINLKEKNISQWVSSGDGRILPPFDSPSDEDVFVRFTDAFRQGEKLFTEEMGGEALEAHYKYLMSIPAIGEIAGEMKATGIQFPTFQVFNLAFFKYGYLMFITYEQVPAFHEIFQRFAKVFEQTYTRFLDLQKAEVQAREALIEAALERVRSRAMAMQKSEELLQVIKTLSEQLRQLGLHAEAVSFLTDGDERGYNMWLSSPDEDFLSKIFVPRIQDRTSGLFLEAKETGKSYYSYVLSKEEKDIYFQNFFDNTILRDYPDNGKEQVFAAPGMATTNVLLEGIILSVSNFDTLPFSKEDNEIINRIASVFQQSYTRFLDLQKAEVQAREAQIEAALERVRSRSMAMHKSEEFPELIQVVFEQFQQLNFKIDSAQFDVSFRESDDLNLWAAAPGQPYPTKLHIPYADYEVINSIKKAKKAGLEFVSSQLTKEEKNDFFEYFFLHVPDIPEERKKLILSRPGMVRSVILLDQVSLAIQNYSGILYSDAEHSILKRFAKAFEQSYIRFLDLQKAEAQAREAQIEAALERVRARAMAMHASQELSEVVHELRKQMGILGQKDLETCVIHLHDESPDFIQSWAAIKPPDEEGDILESIANVPKKGLNIIEEALEAYTAKHHDYVILNKGEKLRQWFSFLRKEVPEGFAKLVESVQGNIEDLRSYWSFSDFSGGSLLMVTRDKPDESTRSLLRRFANVFGLAYRRFADLKYAEAIAREAQIQTGLERLRARTMAMHKSSELTSVVKVMFNEFKSLQGGDDLQKIVRAFITNANQSAGHFELWATDTDGAELKQQYVIRYDEPTNGILMHDAWTNKKPWFVNDLTGERLRQWIQYLTNIKFVTSIKGWGERRVNTFIYYSRGFIGVTALSPLSKDSIELLRRFAAVFEQTYTRFLDLQQAEANALEATRRASIERVRGEIASMRTPDDLERITPLVWNELKALGVPFFRCGVFIINEGEAMTHVYLSTPEGQSIARLHLPFGSSQIAQEAVASWRTQEVYKTHWGREDFQTWVQTLVQQGHLQSDQQYKAGDEAPEHLWLHYIPFAQGMLYVGSDHMLNDEHLALVHALADAFATAYARYEDFTRIEDAKKQIEKTLEDLKVTQRQLIQSEKMASLGELTAGIAHEIQNPLNFVNNFSEVSKELIDEMKEELAVGSWQSAVEIADDIVKNLEKINHHGKRADAIVKGMLQHSRSGTGQKELTDINALCDEYLRLAYHGLKARDKSFNAKFEFLPDQTLPKVDVMQQEIGRVVLNLINNAFYAVSEKQKSTNGTYVPTVIVSTHSTGSGIEIKVSDNGMGIPDKVMEKIFQPFFTTKPTGQGTGLGLSLSYDIVKAHGGDLKVETKEGEGSEFIITLSIA